MRLVVVLILFSSGDPDFDPKLKAFYYARVIEIPTPRWTAYDAKRFGVEMSKEVLSVKPRDAIKDSVIGFLKRSLIGVYYLQTKSIEC